ncbi:MAG: MFS transporter [Caulobacterales bacterium]|nr:MFS transporter [Caulobacterales bacterium]
MTDATAAEGSGGAAPDTGDDSYPSSAYAWGLVALLWLAYVSSFIDRYIYGLLAQQIKADLELSDIQVGLIGGLAFALFYATSGVLLGWLADHRRRTWIVGVGVVVWSLATAASGLAKSYMQLFLARVGVGAGEATLSPCAMSMIADSFPPERRGKPIAVYSSALVIGAGVANLASAAIIQWTMQSPVVSVPMLGDLAPWQVTFLIVGLPGLLIAVPFFIIREPTRRRAKTADASLGDGHLSDTLAYVGRHVGAFAGITAIVCVMTITAYSQSVWMPATFERTYGWSPSLYGLVNGITILCVSPTTYLVTGWLSDRMSSNGKRDAPFLIMGVGAMLLVPTGVAAPLAPTGAMAFTILIFNTIGIGVVSAVGVTALLQVTPGKIRAQVVALYYMAISLTGLIIGPVGVGYLSDLVFGEENLRYAMAVMPLITGVAPLAFLPWARRLYGRELERMHGAA